jgi:hypothetical protein
MLSAHRQFAWALAIIFVALVLPRAGWASCGDYLHHAGRLTPDLSQDRGDQDAPLRPARCRGPNCSARTPFPVPPAAPKLTPVGPRQQMYWLVENAVRTVIAHWNVEEADDLDSLLTAGRLFRPPRAS